jgi:hypothetical protein
VLKYSILGLVPDWGRPSHFRNMFRKHFEPCLFAPGDF